MSERDPNFQLKEEIREELRRLQHEAKWQRPDGEVVGELNWTDNARIINITWPAGLDRLDDPESWPRRPDRPEEITARIYTSDGQCWIAKWEPVP